MTHTKSDPMTNLKSDPMTERTTDLMTDPLIQTKTMRLVENCEVRKVLHSCNVFLVNLLGSGYLFDEKRTEQFKTFSSFLWLIFPFSNQLVGGETLCDTHS